MVILMAAEHERSRWTDAAIDERVKGVDNILDAVSAVPQSVATLAVRYDKLDEDVDELGALVREARTELRTDIRELADDNRTEHRRLHTRIDEVLKVLGDELTNVRKENSERDREYRRNVIIALAPLALAALAILAKLLGAPLPGPGGT